MLVDLSDCGFIDSTGLSLLVEAKRQPVDDDRRFGVCCPDADVRRLLELTGIDQAVGLFDTRDEAVAALSNGSPPEPRLTRPQTGTATPWAVRPAARRTTAQRRHRPYRARGRSSLSEWSTTGSARRSSSL